MPFRVLCTKKVLSLLAPNVLPKNLDLQICKPQKCLPVKVASELGFKELGRMGSVKADSWALSRSSVRDRRVFTKTDQ